MPITLDGSNGITTPTYAGSDTAEYLVPVTQFKNRLINSGMVIDQRNNGSSITPNNGQYSLDRWKCWQAAASKFSIQQSTTVPPGFRNSIAVTSLSSYSVGADEYFAVEQIIEGFNVADLNWGTANAKTVTLSFQVRSSLTGTFGGAINNGGLTRSYPFSYTISSANTWTTVSVTIPGDTTGTWNTNADGGMRVWFSLGSGANNVGTVNTWAGAWYTAPTGSVSVVGTNAATWFITGVQLEVGSTATSFDYRPYGTELQLCRRYAQVYRSNTNGIIFPNGWYFDGNNIRFVIMFDQEMRAACAVTFFGTANTDYLVMQNASGQSGFTWGAEQFGTRSVVIQAGKTSHGLTNIPTLNLYIATSNAGGIIVSAEL